MAVRSLPAAVLGNIKVDQLGYLTWTPKVAVLARPMVGQGSPSSFDPGASFEIRRVSDDGTAFSGSTASFGGGATHAQSGDIGWWADFSGLTTPGDYYLYLPGGTNAGARSYPFSLGPDVYTAALAASAKSYYYQRCGTAIDAAHGGAWTHAACHVASQSAAHLYDGGDQGAGTARDITGGWHDAGDYRKYVSFTVEPLWDLLHSWDWYPCGYGDATGIPESGNGVPDILDEVKWELDWLLKMQISGGADDGALYSGAFVTGGAGGTGDPSTETATYYYANKSSAATGAGAFAFALGARLLGSQPAYAAYAATLQAAAERAWTWLQAHPTNVTYNHTGFNNANANRAADEDAALRLLAAAELYALTGTGAYKTYFDANYNSAALTNNGHNPILNNYFETGASGFTERALVSYALAPGATASVVTAIRAAAKNGADTYPVGYYQTDLYRSFMWDGHYSWGSNQAKATWGDVCLWAVQIGADPTRNAVWRNVASEYLHYFFGRNTLGWSFTTQSQLVGAEQPVTQFFHSWFADGTAWDANPAPGILVGGPNQAYATDVGYSGGTAAYPPAGQPVQKSYRDWNTVWPDCSWTVTENGIYYQAKYQMLLSAFSGCTAPPGTPTPSRTLTQYAGTPTLTFTATPSATPTASPTPVCQTLLNGAETLAENGTWSGGNAVRSIVAAGSAPAGAVTQGGSALAANVTVTAGWNDGIANLAGFAPSNWAAYTSLKMDVYVPPSFVAGATYTELRLHADCSSCGAGLWYQPISADHPALVAGAQTLTWALDFTQGSIPPGSPLSKITLIYNNDATAPTGTLYFDNLRLVGPCVPTPTASPSRTASPSATPTRSPSPSPTSTPSGTPSVTASPSPTGSPTPSLTGTASPTPSATASPTFTSSATFSVSPTETSYAGTPTDTATPSVSPSRTPSWSASPTSNPSASNSPTPADSPTASPSPSPSPVASATPDLQPPVLVSVSPAAGSVLVPGDLARLDYSVDDPYYPALDQVLLVDALGQTVAGIATTNGGAPSSGLDGTFVPFPGAVAAAAEGLWWLSFRACDGYANCAAYSVSFTVRAPTATPSPSPSPTGTSSATPSATPAASPTASSSPTTSPSPPVPATASPTPTRSPTPSGPASATPTPVPASTAPGTLVIEAATGWPNPGPTAILFKLSGPADRVVLRLYTPAWVAVLETGDGPWNAGWNKLNLGSQGATLPAGLLYARLRAQRGEVFSDARTVRVYVLH